ncbi:MAG: AsmA family protein, partial [Acetobacteraceae bacterium]|nr:AsmA family protein [Acetobacteraceae bacterium]
MRRWLIAAGALLLGLPLLAVAGLALFLDADSLRPRVVAAVEGATGRRFVLDRLHLTPALAPTVVAEGVRLGNVEGGSAPDMLRARRAEIRLALLPLLSGRVELHRIAVEDADLLIEQGNWRFAPRAAEPAPSSGTAPSPRRPARPIELRELALRDIRATIGGEALRLPRADIAQGADGGLELRATLLARGADVTLEGRAAGLGDGPFRLAATWPGARVTAEGERG